MKQPSQHSSISYQSSKLNSQLQPIMEYSQQYKPNVINASVKYRTVYQTEKEVPLNNSKQEINSSSGYGDKKKKKLSVVGHSSKQKGKPQLYSSQNQNQNESSIQYISSHYHGNNSNFNNTLTSSSKQPTYKSPSHPYQQSAPEHQSSSSKILSQHNSSSSYNSSLFPQSQSLKEQLKQNVQEEMLSNYYINKYSALMSKITNEKIKIQLPNQNDVEQLQKVKEETFSKNNFKKRKNFKEVMRKKQEKTNQAINTSKNKKGHVDNEHSLNKSQQHPPNQHFSIASDNNRDNQFLTVTFSPSKRFNLHINDQKLQKNSRKLSKSRSNPKSVSHSKSAEKVSLDRLKNSKRDNSIAWSINRGNKQSRSKNKSIKDYCNESQDIISKITQKLSSSNNYPLLKKPKHSSNSPNPFPTPPHPTTKPTSSNHLPQQTSPSRSYHSSPPRLNFKQSLKQKKSLYLQYEDNLNLYKRLQSSIINELYSPSPRQIENSRWQEIELHNRELTNEELEELEREYLGIGTRDQQNKAERSKKEHYFNSNNIEINDNEEELEQLQKQYYEREKSHQTSRSQKQHQINLLRQNIRNSVSRNKPSINQYSPDLNQQQKSSPSYKKPLESPKRSLISDQYKSKPSSSSSPNKQDHWNPYFTNDNKHNKKLLIGENITTKRRVDIIADMNSKTSPQKPERKYHSLERVSPQRTKTFEKVNSHNQVSQKSFRKNANSLRIEIKQEEQPESDIQIHQKKSNKNSESLNNKSSSGIIKKHETKSQVNGNLHYNSYAPSNSTSNAPKTHQRKGSFNSIKSSPKPQPQSRYINEDHNSSKNSHRQNKSPSHHPEQQDDDIEFVPPADQAQLFDSRQSQNHFHQNQSITQSRKNHIQTIGRTRSRKPSDQLSFISDSNSFHEMSMLSRFSMTSEEGSMIIHKLDNQITENQFGPYQNALESLRDLLHQNKTAWPIYVVGQKILDDRADYEKKIQLQKNILQDYRQKIIHLKQLDQIEGKTEETTILKNQLQILRLIRELASQV